MSSNVDPNVDIWESYSKLRDKILQEKTQYKDLNSLKNLSNEKLSNKTLNNDSSNNDSSNNDSDEDSSNEDIITFDGFYCSLCDKCDRCEPYYCNYDKCKNEMDIYDRTYRINIVQSLCHDCFNNKFFQTLEEYTPDPDDSKSDDVASSVVCDMCRNVCKDVCDNKWYRSNKLNFDCCVKCYNPSIILNANRYTVYDCTDPNKLYFIRKNMAHSIIEIDKKETEYIIPEKFKNLISEYNNETYTTNVESLYYSNINSSPLDWVQITDMVESLYHRSERALVVNCRDPKHPVALIIEDSCCRILIDKIYDNLDDFMKDFDEWQKNQSKEELDAQLATFASQIKKGSIENIPPSWWSD
jgi:hypothetical protein